MENPAVFFTSNFHIQEHQEHQERRGISWIIMDIIYSVPMDPYRSISIHIDPISESLLFGTLFLVIIKVLTVSRLEGPGPRASRNQRSLRLEGYFV